MLFGFFDNHEVVHHAFISQGQTVNKEYYVAVLRRVCAHKIHRYRLFARNIYTAKVLLINPEFSRQFHTNLFDEHKLDFFRKDLNLVRKNYSESYAVEIRSIFKYLTTHVIDFVVICNIRFMPMFENLYCKSHLMLKCYTIPHCLKFYLKFREIYVCMYTFRRFENAQKFDSNIDGILTYCDRNLGT